MEQVSPEHNLSITARQLPMSTISKETGLVSLRLHGRSEWELRPYTALVPTEIGPQKQLASKLQLSGWL